MGRLDHVQQTLLANIESNRDYPAAEFVLLDYGSNDGLADWVRSTAYTLIVEGKLVYGRVDGVSYYSHSHSKNVAFLAASGEIVCNIDADNLMPPGFAFHLNDVIHRSPRVVASFDKVPYNTLGRLAMRREDFIRVGGYDEEFEGWGWDDKDLKARLIASGCQLEWMEPQFAQFLPHDDGRRVENMRREHQARRQTSDRNAARSRANLEAGRIVANGGRMWGSATMHRNFSETLVIGASNAD